MEGGLEDCGGTGLGGQMVTTDGGAISLDDAWG